MAGGLGKVEGFDLVGNQPDQAFTDAHPRDVDGFLGKAARREQLKHALAQQIDRADLAIERFADDLDYVVELRLRMAARRHDFVQTCEDRPGRFDGDSGHPGDLAQSGRFGNATNAGAAYGRRSAVLNQRRSSSSLILSFRFLRVWSTASSGKGRFNSSSISRSIPACLSSRALTCVVSIDGPPILAGP